MNFDDAIAFATGVLKADERFKDVDLSPASATFNMAVLPFALMQSASWDNVQWAQARLLFSDSDVLDPSALDEIGRMLMAPHRRTEGGVTVEVSMYFRPDASCGPITVNVTDTFTAGSAVGNPLREFLIDPSILPTSVLDGVSYRVVKIPVRFEGSGAIAVGSVNRTSVIAAGLDRVANVGASSTPLPAQTNAEYLDAIKNSLSTRNDVNTASIAANYGGSYGITDLSVVGYGDPEMQRDVAVAAKGWSGHFGSCIDAYVRMPIDRAEFRTTVLSGGAGKGSHTFSFKRYGCNAIYGVAREWSLTENAPQAPIVLIDWKNTKIAGLGYDEFAPDGDVGYKTAILPDGGDSFWGKNYRYSIYEGLEITVNTPVNGKSGDVLLAYWTIPMLEGLQESAAANPLLNCDLLFKSFIPVHVKRLHLAYAKGYNLDEGEWRVRLADRVNSWRRQDPIRFNELFEGVGVPVKLQETNRDMEALPYKVDGDGIVLSANSGAGPLSPSYALMHIDNIDGSRVRYLSTRQIYPNSLKSGLSASPRTCRYFIDPEDITFAEATW